MGASFNNDINFDIILPHLAAQNVEQVYQKLANHVANLIGTPEELLIDKIIENDKQASSAIGHGVAVAQAKLPRLTRPITVFAKIERPVNFTAPDHEDVDMIALVLSPEFEPQQHLLRLSSTIRFFNNNEIRKSLRATNDYSEIKNIVRESNVLKRVA